MNNNIDLTEEQKGELKRQGVELTDEQIEVIEDFYGSFLSKVRNFIFDVFIKPFLVKFLITLGVFVVIIILIIIF